MSSRPSSWTVFRAMSEHDEPPLADEPIGDGGSDRFRRGSLARNVAGLIRRSAQGRQSSVVAVVGPWGSGKTSLLNMVRRELAASDISIVEFNPWMVASLESLVAEFFNALLENVGRGRRRRTVAKAVNRYASAVSPVVATVPLPGASTAGAVTAAGTRIGAQPVATLRRTVEAALNAGDQSFLVIIDDVDRLQPDELLTLFKLIRLVGRLPRVHYLVAFDQESVTQALTGSHDGGDGQALAYLEKIVQVRVDLPPLHESDIDALVDESFLAVLAVHDVVLGPTDEARLARVYERRLRPGLAQPRQIQRLFVQFEQALSLVVGEVDPVDLLLLSFLRVAHPAAYSALPRLRDKLTRNLRYEVEAQNMDATQKRKLWERVLSDRGVPSDQADTVIGILADLFPTVAEATSTEAPDDGQLRLGRHVGSSEYFDRYFQLGIPPDDLADSFVSGAIAALCDGTADAAAVDALAAAMRASPRRLLPKMREAWVRTKPADDFTLARFVIDAYDEFRKEPSGIVRQPLPWNGGSPPSSSSGTPNRSRRTCPFSSKTFLRPLRSHAAWPASPPTATTQIESPPRSMTPPASHSTRSATVSFVTPRP